ncbi:MAG: hypothetical protein JWO52_3541 [Gammaproteobacteria bacterium]|jgi:hypothetical protein|nr:hypothetical protein [Gammaproteobacteria bacterium]
MHYARGLRVLCAIVIVVSASAPALHAQALRPVGNLDCNGYSAIQSPLKTRLWCSDFFSSEYGQRGYDNGHYIGHDEPSIGFISTAPHSGNSVQWDITLPKERPLPATQTFENYVAFWFAMAICDPNSIPNGPCIPDSDRNTPFIAGSALMELQFYPPGFPPFITQISCDLTHWCAALNIDSLEAETSGKLNPNCTEPVNFAFLQTNGVPTGPPGPDTATAATLTPNNQTLRMNQGDHLHVTLTDTSSGLLTRIDDLTTGQSGFMVASGANGFRNTDPNTCAGASFDFHPEFDTAKFGNFVPWAALQANVNLAVEIGHFIPGLHGDNDADDAPCFPGPTLPGCLNLAEGGDIDFDGSSYRFDWPDGTRNTATSFAVRSVAGNGLGPLSRSSDGRYDKPFPIIQFETDVSASEQTCQSNGVGCVVPPTGAQFYPFYSLENGDGSDACTLVFGNLTGRGTQTFGRDAQYGPANLPWFFGQNSGGPQANPCVSKAEGDN